MPLFQQSVQKKFIAELDKVKVEKEKGTYRILCFGDSWTFGWGVDVEYSWPMQMENYLKAIEVRMIAKLRVNDSLETKGYTFDFEQLRKTYHKR